MFEYSHCTEDSPSPCSLTSAGCIERPALHVDAASPVWSVGETCRKCASRFTSSLRAWVLWEILGPSWKHWSITQDIMTCNTQRLHKPVLPPCAACLSVALCAVGAFPELSPRPPADPWYRLERFFFPSADTGSTAPARTRLHNQSSMYIYPRSIHTYWTYKLYSELYSDCDYKFEFDGSFFFFNIYRWKVQIAAVNHVLMG